MLLSTLVLLASIAPDPARCGGAGPLTVAGETLAATVGEKVVLPLHGNRQAARLQYQWRVVAQPSGSRQVVEQPSGQSRSAWAGADRCRQVYSHGQVPAFTADLPGRYDFEVRAVDLDTGEVALARAEIVASGGAWRGPGSGAGCSAPGGGPAFFSFLRRGAPLW